MSIFNDTDRLLTHFNCMDGATCAILFMAAAGEFRNIIFSGPSHERTDLILENLLLDGPARIWLADISISEEMASLLSGMKFKRYIRIFDHHKSAIPLNSFPFAEIDENNERCGSKIFFDFLKKSGCEDIDEFEYLVSLADDRDRWVNANPESLKMSELFHAIGQKSFIGRMLLDPPVAGKDNFREEEKYLLEIEQRNKEDAIKYLKRTVQIRQQNGRKIGFSICDPKYASDAGNALLADLSLDGIVLVSANSISLRASKDSSLDVSELAKRYGGGGHAKAAGCSVKDVIGSPLLEMVMDSLEI